jgi:modulator of FtsH protease HflC
MGIELVDVRIKRINYIESVRRQVESRMISERQSIAARFRSEGEGAARRSWGRWSGSCARFARRPSGRPRRSAARPTPRPRGSTGRPTAPIPNSSRFFRTLESYRAMGKNTTLMIGADAEFFRYLESTQQP